MWRDGCGPPRVRGAVWESGETEGVSTGCVMRAVDRPKEFPTVFSSGEFT